MAAGRLIEGCFMVSRRLALEAWSQWRLSDPLLLPLQASPPLLLYR
jgi:hypothetical protein